MALPPPSPPPSPSSPPSTPASSTKTRGSQTEHSTIPLAQRGVESQFVLFGGAARTQQPIPDRVLRRKTRIKMACPAKGAAIICNTLFVTCVVFKVLQIIF